MAKFELKLPKMGESVAEATVTNWLKEVGDSIEMDEPVVEIATDKVDSEVPSEVEGVLVEKLFDVDDVVEVGQTIAIIEIEGEGAEEVSTEERVSEENVAEEEPEDEAVAQAAQMLDQGQETAAAPAITNDGARFYSPLVKNIAQEEGIAQEELDKVPGTGLEGRVTKDDILKYVEHRGKKTTTSETNTPNATPKETTSAAVQTPVSVNGGDEIIEMTRMGKMISKHMMASVQTSAHVQSFIEVDVTTIWNWRNKVKAEFEKREGEKLTFTPIFMEAVAKAIRDFPLINISVDGDKIVKKKDINLGMAAALPDGNLIVPVIKKADQLNLVGMAKAVNDLASRARAGKLKPDDTQGGTYTVTNVGTFGSVMGTPIINQPQVGILALGAIRKVPAVIETPEGDFIGIRHKMFLSHSYDHRVVNGALGGQFVQRVAQYLEAWDANRVV
ncbi:MULTISPECIES: dihydrolipoamide acetyltransferase family protein [Leeuwenhoekiella]|jgi:2-oxoglutarate dehydrogenase E2 component (dihydrolipoamide succinyltransferase)|uniref:dihydrolipoamide acetyltransferase family protein n=1 Tax=Leeuwenhoekiella TaxID=283735 RepID=UPI000C3A03CA|nr:MULTISPECIES: dihydrolipoamide acetyltransferase family protein [Leeuwenhoekiella]MAO44404.1 diapophytoene dehydrogenase [Leeuwenhoekiella sp.]HBT09619.1 diapophytoene dehydrogenase [Leeuwenhoekiella sp.]|tara:strand:- start:715 stop:2049 length:1335 start_codon:yes stop_codon:yes gene_type:complete